MRLRALIGLLVAALALSAAACGGGDGEGIGTTDFFDTGFIDTGLFEEPPPVEEPPPAPVEALQIRVPDAGQSVGPQSPAERIAEVQRALLALGFKIGRADGVYGQKTRNAVARFQRNHDLEADGIVGPKTARAMNRELRRRGAAG
jgi:peptidoglycan hydrolase-like protein with peptidoglycan-binding domain